MIPDTPILTVSEREQIAEILKRRANDISDFERKLTDAYGRISVDEKYFGPRIELPGSIELSFDRERKRLRRLADKINPPVLTEEDEP